VHAYHGVRDAAQHDGMISMPYRWDGKMVFYPRLKAELISLLKEITKITSTPLLLYNILTHTATAITS